jgi:TolA-binding protein
MIEAKISPAAPTIKGLNAQQKSATQLPALFKPKTTKVLGAKTDPKNPMAGYMVGSNESEEPTKSSLEEAMQEVEEDMLSKVKKDLTTYLDQLEQKVRVDRDLKDKAKDEIEDQNPAKPGRQTHHEEEVDEDPTPSEAGDTMQAPPVPVEDPTLAESPVKTFALEDGTFLECYGDEGRGFEIRRGGRAMPTRFPNLDHADMAVKLYQARRKQQDDDQDYIEEK